MEMNLKIPFIKTNTLSMGDERHTITSIFFINISAFLFERYTP